MNKIDLIQSLIDWKESQSTSVSGQARDEGHLSQEKLSAMVADHGIPDALDADKSHLSSCPACLSYWSALCRGDDPDFALNSPVDWSFGAMEEGGVSGQTGRLESKNGCFTLQVEVDLLSRDKLTISLTSQGSTYDGRQAKVRDKNGTVILSGSFDAGLVTDSLLVSTPLDLSLWTVIVGQPPLHQG